MYLKDAMILAALRGTDFSGYETVHPDDIADNIVSTVDKILHQIGEGIGNRTM